MFVAKSFILAIDQQTIHIYIFIYNHIIIQAVLQYVVHKRLKYFRCITQYHWHYQTFLLTVLRVESSLSYIFRFKTNLMKRSLQIHCRKYAIITEAIKRLCNLVLLCFYLIQCTIANNARRRPFLSFTKTMLLCKENYLLFFSSFPLMNPHESLLLFCFSGDNLYSGR